MDDKVKGGNSQLEVEIEVKKGLVNKLIVRVTEYEKNGCCHGASSHCHHGDYSPPVARGGAIAESNNSSGHARVIRAPTTEGLLKIDYSSEEGDDSGTDKK